MDNQNQWKSAVGLWAAVSPVRNMLNSITNRHNAARDEIARQKLQEEMDQSQNMYECSLITDDEDVKKKNLSGCNLNNMSTLIKTYYSWMNNHDCDTMDPAQTCCYFLNRNPEAERITDAVLKCEEGVDLEMWADRVWIQNDQEPQIEDPYIQDFTENWDGKWKNWWNVALWWAWVITALNSAAYPVGRWLELAGEYTYNSMFRPTQDASNQLINKWGTLDYLQWELEGAEKNLKALEQSWQPTEDAIKNYNEIKKQYEAAKKAFEGIETTSQTASKYGIGKWLFKNWTFEGWGRQAIAEAQKLWNKVIDPAMWLVNEWINIDEITKWLWKEIEPTLKYDKEAVEDYVKAYDKIVEWFTGEEFKNVNIRDARTIKTRLQKQVEDIFVKWSWGEQKNIAPAIKKIKSLLGGKIKDAFHKLLQKAGLKDSETLFKDWWNLTDIAERMAWIDANWSVLGNTIDKNIKAWFKNILFTKWSNFVKSLGRWLKKTSWINLLKKSPELLKVIAPWDLLMPDFWEQFWVPNGIQLAGELIDNAAYINELEKVWEERLQQEIEKEDWYKSLVEEEDVTPLLEKWITEEQLMELLNSLE